MNAWLGSIAPAPVLRAPMPRAKSHTESAPGERHLLEAARRCMSPGWTALVVRFGRGRARAHHRRIARALLDDAMHRHGGQVFALRGGDLVLLGPAAALRGLGGQGKGAEPGEPLADLLARLLGAGTAEALSDVVTWPLPDARDALLTYATERLGDTGASPLDPAPVEPPASTTRAADGGLLAELLLRQTAVMFGGGRRRMTPLFREIRCLPTPMLPAGQHGEPDPLLQRHLAARLDDRLLAALPEEAGRRGAIDIGAGPPLHLNLAPSQVLGDAFARLATLCRDRGASLGVEFALTDIAGDTDAYTAARKLLFDAGIDCVIDGVSPMALRLTDTASLAPDLVKLEWSTAMARLSAGEAEELDAAILHLGAHRVLVEEANDEAALQWGLSRGIRRFQGRHVDAMLAASRLGACLHAEGCALRQCTERASAVALAGRHGCRNTPLLDAAVPLESLA